MVRKASPDEVRSNDLVQFIVQVRKLTVMPGDLQRTLGVIRNLANKMFRDYIGYSARGEYRLRLKHERCFSDDVQQTGQEPGYRRLGQSNAALAGRPPVTGVSEGPEEPGADVPLVTLDDLVEEAEREQAAEDAEPADIDLDAEPPEPEPPPEAGGQG